MVVGISNCIKFLDDLEVAILSAISLAKSSSSVVDKAMAGIALGGKIISIIGNLKDILPELKDVDGAEAGQLSSRLYNLVLKVIKSF